MKKLGFSGIILLEKVQKVERIECNISALGQLIFHA